MVVSRERIVRSAAKMFLTRSYASVGISDLCTAADVHKGSFYHFFASKAELAKAVVDLHAAEFDRRFAEAKGLYAVAGAVADVQGAFEEKFGRIVGCPFGNLAAELSTTDDELRVHVAAVFDRWEKRLVAACEQAPLRDGVEPEQLARMILAQIQGQILIAKVRLRPATEIAAGIRALISANLKEPG
ncbi:TetR/AcrR family transcriptional regulator [Kibdelosporangium persicum]|uniref:Transcriptional regulator n=1 Tax=Kibdelosporangium persicum TaxID=2698649 RepID=A0ABX2EVA3_9PSEU|nr:TetR/AcrR family transcriptional regulator [Kibdelosporangium persicum]NRN62963.1 Transcriptional regulator [Kibdelosporangium persicum]